MVFSPPSAPLTRGSRWDPHILFGVGGRNPPRGGSSSCHAALSSSRAACTVGRRIKALDGAKAPALPSPLTAGISALHPGRRRSCPGVLN